MSKYNNEYFFIRQPRNSDHLPFLCPDINTEDRTFRFEAQPPGSPPLVFFNGWKKENLQQGIRDVATKILFNGSNLVVDTSIREKLIPLEVPNLFLHPAIYIDDRDNWHENYWYMTFTQQFDCWDRTHSVYVKEPVRLGGFELYSVYSYSLNEALLDKTPLNQRLLFEMGSTQDGMVVCHKSIMRIFIDEGAKLVPIGAY